MCHGNGLVRVGVRLVDWSGLVVGSRGLQDVGGWQNAGGLQMVRAGPQ